VLGEGKPENQNASVIFCFGEVIQAIDMNQDNNLAEAFKVGRQRLCVRLWQQVEMSNLHTQARKSNLDNFKKAVGRRVRTVQLRLPLVTNPAPCPASSLHPALVACRLCNPSSAEQKGKMPRVFAAVPADAQLGQ
jgi:hypothetical protein